MYSILLVDDEFANRDPLSRRLIRLGYKVDQAASGAEALAMAARQPCDLVLLDVMMPEMDGLEVLTQLRETWNEDELPVIMVTACSKSADVVAALQLGANDYVTKPVNFRILAERIESQVQARGQRDSAAKKS